MDTWQTNTESTHPNNQNGIFIPKKILIAILLLVILILVAGSTYYKHLSHKSGSVSPETSQSRENNQSQRQQQSNITDSQTSDQKHYNMVIAQARAAQNKESYLAAASSLMQYAQQSTNADNRYNALLDAGDMYANSGEYQQALNTFKKSEQLKGITFAECANAGFVAKALGQKQTAIFYFQKCISLMPESYFLRDKQIQSFNQLITQESQ